MAVNAQSFVAIGGQVYLTSFTKAAFTQTDLNTLVSFLSATTRVLAIGGDQSPGEPIVFGTSGVVTIITDGGVAPAASSNFAGVGFVAAPVTYFSMRYPT